MNKFKELLSLVNEYLEGYTSLSKKEIIERIEECFHDEKIEGTQYDYLIGILE